MSEVHFTVDKRGVRGVGNLAPMALRELIETVENISDEVERTATLLAPEGETGHLKEHPVDRSETHVGNVTRGAAFGGGTPVKGAGGRFVGAARTGSIGNAVVLIDISVAKDPFYAEYVHEGTGIYGKFHHVIVPRTKPFMRFTWHGKRFKVKSVRGQSPQPYLTEAFEVVERTFVPLEVSKLRAKLETLSAL